MSNYHLAEDIPDTEEELLAIASWLDACFCPEMLADLRQIIPAPLLNKAAKKLTPEKHEQIKQWAIALNSAKSKTKNEGSVSPKKPLK